MLEIQRRLFKALFSAVTPDRIKDVLRSIARSEHYDLAVRAGLSGTIFLFKGQLLDAIGMSNDKVSKETGLPRVEVNLAGQAEFERPLLLAFDRLDEAYNLVKSVAANSTTWSGGEPPPVLREEFYTRVLEAERITRSTVESLLKMAQKVL